MRVQRVDSWCFGALAVLLIWTLVEGTLELDLRTGRIGRLDDFAEAMDLARQVAETGAYPTHFTYAPPAVALRLGLAVLGTGAGLLWIAAMIAAFVGTLWAVNRLVGEPPWPGARALLTTFACGYAVQWDFRSVNGNLIWVALALAAILAVGHPWRAGALLAAAVSLKVYAIVLLPWLLWRRPAVAVPAFVGLLVAFVGVPAVAFGPVDAVAVTRSWFAASAATSAADFPLTYHGYSTSVHTALVALFSEGGRYAVADMSLERIGALAGVLRSVALIAGVGLTVLARRDLPTVAGLLAVALVASPMAQPAHGVVALLAVGYLLAGAFDPAAPRVRRAVHIGAVCLGWGFLEIAPTGPAMAFATNAALLVWAGAAVAVEIAGERRPELGDRDPVRRRNTKPGKQQDAEFHGARL
jgi:hypothetical protein